MSIGSEDLTKIAIRLISVSEDHAIYGRKIRTQNTENKSGSRLTHVNFWVAFQNTAKKCLVFFLHLLYVITKNFLYERKSKVYNIFEAEIIIIEIKFYKGAKRVGGKRESRRNDSGANGKVGETTRGRNDSGRKGKWAK